MPKQQASQEQQLLPPLALPNDASAQSRIALEPALMTYLDALKRKTFLAEWESAVIQN